ERVELGERERPAADDERTPVTEALGRRGQHLRKRSEHGSPSPCRAGGSRANDRTSRGKRGARAPTSEPLTLVAGVTGALIRARGDCVRVEGRCACQSYSPSTTIGTLSTTSRRSLPAGTPM